MVGEYILLSPIARFDLAAFGISGGDSLLGLLFQGSTYLFLFIELFFLPLFFIPLARKWVWLFSALWHVLALILLQIPFVSSGMLLFHLVILDRSWWVTADSDGASNQ